MPGPTSSLRGVSRVPTGHGTGGGGGREVEEPGAERGGTSKEEEEHEGREEGELPCWISWAWLPRLF